MTQGWLTSRPVLATLAIAVALAVHAVWAQASGAQKLTGEEIARAAELSGNHDRLDIEVRLPFEPEQFHFLRFQDIGRMAGAEDTSVFLRSVPVAAARALARNYWVSDIVPLETP